MAAGPERYHIEGKMVECDHPTVIKPHSQAKKGGSCTCEEDQCFHLDFVWFYIIPTWATRQMTQILMEI